MRQSKTHLLILKAQEFEKPNKELDPNGCRYDVEIGAWIKKDSGELLADTSDMQGLATKKNDIETGEDLKSE